MEKVKRPIWILCNPRSGSSYLCELLNNTARFETVRKGRAFGEWLKYYPSYEQFAQNPPIFNKCTRRQFMTLIGDRTREEFESVLPGIRYLVVHRKDLYAQAVSMYIAKSTDQYHLFSEDSRNEYLNQKIEFDEELMLKLYKNALSYPMTWKGFLGSAPHLEIFYEELIKDPASELERVSRYLEVPLTPGEIHASASRHRLIPTKRPETEDFIKRLKDLVRTTSSLSS